MIALFSIITMRIYYYTEYIQVFLFVHFELYEDFDP